MRMRLGKYARPKAIGLFLDEQEVTISVVGTTLFGTVEIASRTEPFAPDQLGATLQELLRPWIGRRQRVRLPVAVGLPASRVFFSTRSLRQADDGVSDQAMLQRMLASPTINIDDFIVESRKSPLGREPTVSRVACRRKYLIEVIASLEACGVRPFRVEPGPYALVRAAVLKQRGPRKAKTILRILLGRDQGLIVLTAANRPVAWRSFPLVPGAEPGMILCATRTMGMLRTQYGVESPIDVAVIHGRPDLHSRLSEESFVTEMQFPVVCCEHPVLASPSAAFGLAMGCLHPSADAFDLAQSLKPRAPLWEVFSWGELALQGIPLACMGLLLLVRSGGLNDALAVTQAEVQKYPWVGAASVGDLRKQKEDLQKRVDTMGQFLSSRVFWTSCTRDLPSRLPANTVLTSLHGSAGLGGEGGSTKRSLVLQAVVPIQGDEWSRPPEIDAFVTSLRGAPLRDFPAVELGDVKRSQLASAQPIVNFTVVFLSKTQPTAPVAGPAPAPAAAPVAAPAAGDHSGQKEKDAP